MPYLLPNSAPQWQKNIEDKILPHQEVTRQFIIDHPQCGIFLTMGGGKTLATLSAHSYLQPAGHTLIISPLNIAKNTWTQEIEDWGFPVRAVSLAVRESKRIDKETGKPKMVKLSKRERHARLEAVLTDPPTMYIASASNLVDIVEYFATAGGTLTHPQYNRWPFANVVIDESQMFKDPSIKLSQAMFAVRPYISRIQLMTGTPRPEELGNLFGQMLLIDGGQRLGASEDAFRAKYFYAGNMVNGQITKWIPKKGAADEIYNLIGDITISPYNTALDTLPAMHIHNHTVELSESLQKDYKVFARDAVLSFATELRAAGVDKDARGRNLFMPATGTTDADNDPGDTNRTLRTTQHTDLQRDYVPVPHTQHAELQSVLDTISKHSSHAAHTRPNTASGIGDLTTAGVMYITAKNAAALRMKLLQFATGALYVEEFGLDDTRPDIETMADGRGYLPIHSAKLQKTLEILHPIDTAKNPVLICYRFVSDKDRLEKRLAQAGYTVEVFDGSPEMVTRWNNRDIPVMLLQPASAAHGLNLQHGGSTMIWYALPDSSEKYQQANARLHRIGQTEEVDIHRIIVKNTVDANLPTLLENKAKGEQELLDAVRKDVLD